MRKMFYVSLVAFLFLVGCDSNSKKNLEQKTNEVVAKTTQSAKESAKEVIKKTEELAKQAKDSDMVQKIAKKAKDGVAKLSSIVPSTTTSKKQGSDAQKLFTKCAGCHGNKAQNKALGVSHVIAGWDAKKIEDALKGYKAGTYGGAMKAVMQGQASSLSDSDIKALAEYISKL